MQRKLSALVALLSLFAFHLHTAEAQDNGNKAVPPSTTPQALDSTPDNTADLPSILRDSTQKQVRLSEGETVDTLVVRGKEVTLNGTVKHDAVFVDCDVTLGDKAEVGGHLILLGQSRLESGNNKQIHPIAVKSEGWSNNKEFSLAARDKSHVATWFQRQSPRETVRSSAPAKRDSWAGGQFALLVLGLLASLILVFVAPRAAQQATDAVSLEPGRCFIIGAMGAVGMLMVLLFNSMLVKSPVGLLWAPFGAAVAIVPAVILLFGWLCGMRYAGDYLARRFRRFEDGSLYGRIALGLIAFFLVKLILGGGNGTILSGAAVVLEMVVAVMGIGALLISGFGSQPDWLGTRLRGDTRWFRR